MHCTYGVKVLRGYGGVRQRDQADGGLPEGLVGLVGILEDGVDVFEEGAAKDTKSGQSKRSGISEDKGLTNRLYRLA